MTKPYRDDQRRLMVTLPAAQYAAFQRHAQERSLSMTGIVNRLISDYLRAERNADDLTGAGLSERVETLEKRLVTLSAMVTPRPRRERRPKNKTKRENDAANFGGNVQNAAPPTVNAVSTIEPAPTIRREQPSTATPTAEAEPDSTARRVPDEQHERAADVSQRARVPLASTLDNVTTTENRNAEGNAGNAPRIARNAPDLAGGSMIDQKQERRTDANTDQNRTILERRLETKRRAVDYALHSQPRFRIQGAY